MTKAELQTAMAIAARGPRTSRSAAELGRFGMRLKTASFSQASRLSVWKRSAKNKQPSVRVWDEADEAGEKIRAQVSALLSRSRHGRVVARVVCSTYCKDGSCRR